MPSHNSGTYRPDRIARLLAEPRDLDPLMKRIGNARPCCSARRHTAHPSSQLAHRDLAAPGRGEGILVHRRRGDWPDCYQVNRYVKSLHDSAENATDVLHAFERWPTWMWANREVVELAEWLHARNRGKPAEGQVGFYGLDVYSLWDSMRAVTEYLERVDPQLAATARRAYNCFEPFGEDVQDYARATAIVPTSCEDEAIAVLRDLRAKAPEYKEDGREGYFNAEQNALVAKNAELYYRTMVRGGPSSWNVRDRHMVETLDRLMAHHGPGAKAIVWEHNTHIGDARFTDMVRAGMGNVGQLGRQSHRGEGGAVVGFGTPRGTVIAAAAGGAPMERMPVPAAREGSSSTRCTERWRATPLVLATDPTAASRTRRADRTQGDRGRVRTGGGTVGTTCRR